MPIFLGDKLISDMIIGGGDTSDATALVSDILKGKTAYIADGKVTGTLIIPNAGFLIDRRIELNASKQNRQNPIKPIDSLKCIISSEAQIEGQIWPGTYGRSPVLVADKPNQLIFTPYNTTTRLFVSVGKYYYYSSSIGCLEFVDYYEQAGGVWLYKGSLAPTNYVASYGSFLYSIVPIYTNTSFSGIYTAANVAIDEGE